MMNGKSTNSSVMQKWLSCGSDAEPSSFHGIGRFGSTALQNAISVENRSD